MMTMTLNNGRILSWAFASYNSLSSSSQTASHSSGWDDEGSNDGIITTDLLTGLRRSTSCASFLNASIGANTVTSPMIDIPFFQSVLLIVTICTIVDSTNAITPDSCLRINSRRPVSKLQKCAIDEKLWQSLSHVFITPITFQLTKFIRTMLSFSAFSSKRYSPAFMISRRRAYALPLALELPWKLNIKCQPLYLTLAPFKPFFICSDMELGHPSHFGGLILVTITGMERDTVNRSRKAFSESSTGFLNI